MTSIVCKISAVGTRGQAKGKIFIAKPDRSGQFVLNQKVSSAVAGNKTNNARNKVYAASLTEAVKLLETNEYLINLTSDDGKRALRQLSKIRVDYV